MSWDHADLLEVFEEARFELELFGDPLHDEVPGLISHDGGMWRTSRETVDNASKEEVERELRGSYRRIHEKTLAWIAENTTMQVSALDAAQLAAWRAAAKPVYEAYLERTGQVGKHLLAEAEKFR